MDHAVGRFMTHNLADYHFAVHADVHEVDVIFVEERDDAVYHATGVRVRELPITLDKLL
jgi:xanthine dehydrogenase YagR molybdenum-binding subunit